MEMNFGDQTWKAIEQWATTRIASDRVKNDDQKLDAFQTAMLRGRISALKDLLALPKQRAAQVQQDEPH